MRRRVMGTDAHVVVVGGPEHLLAAAAHRLDDLDRRWSRFRARSELCRVNEHAGTPVRVSPDTFHAIDVAVAAWRDTGGRFDPTVGAALHAAGYDRPFARMDLDAAEPAVPVGPAPGCAGVVLDPIVSAVTVPPGTRLDLGGLGKGLAADLTVAALLAGGAAGAMVNLGGDLAAAGEPPSPTGWTISLHRSLGSVTIRGGGVATSAVTRRRWRRDGEPRHHVIDPATGASATGTAEWVTVLAPTAVSAEIGATVALLAGEGAATVLDERAADGIAELADGRLVATGALATFAEAPA